MCVLPETSEQKQLVIFVLMLDHGRPQAFESDVQANVERAPVIVFFGLDSSVVDLDEVDHAVSPVASDCDDVVVPPGKRKGVTLLVQAADGLPPAVRTTEHLAMIQILEAIVVAPAHLHVLKLAILHTNRRMPLPLQQHRGQRLEVAV